MPLICPECGEKEEFERIVYGHEKYSETEIIDKDGEVQDYLNHEVYSSNTDEGEGIKCSKCDSEVEDLTDEGYYKFIWEHTNKNGFWQEDEVPEKDRDETIIENAIADKV